LAAPALVARTRGDHPIGDHDRRDARCRLGCAYAAFRLEATDRAAILVAERGG
jgi:hypothetical protein